MSPEQARGLRTIDSRTDLYSLGLVAFTMLTGQLPFLGETIGDLLLQICSEPLPSLRAAAPALPPAMEDWFKKACARQAEDRYPTAQAFIEALRVAAGISRQSDSVVERGPSLPGLAGPGAVPPEDSAVEPGLRQPSTTVGTTLGAGETRSQRARWLVVTASAIVGLAVAPLIAVLAHGRPARQTVSAAQGATSTGAVLIPRQPDAATSALLAPIASTSETSLPTQPSAVTSPSIESKAANQWRAPPRPVATATPPVPTAKPTATPRATGKSTGAIDLGY
jgi:serine/threonine-protein kinase